MKTAIFTSSFFTRLPDGITAISTARYQPKGFDLPTIRALAPGPWFRSVSVPEYRDRYMAQLSRRSAEEIVTRIEDIAVGGPAALLCWERPRELHWCHRALVSEWLRDDLGLDVYEYGMVEHGCGRSHPKMPPELRIDPAPQLPI